MEVEMERTMGREMRGVEMAGREENLEGVGVIERFWCSPSFVVAVVAVEVGGQLTDADRSRLKRWVNGDMMRFFDGVLMGDGCRSCSGEGWTSVEVGLPLTVFGDVVLGCVWGEGPVSKCREKKERKKKKIEKKGRKERVQWVAVR